MLAAGLAVLAAWAAVAPAAESLPGPVGARVLRVLDGDTIEVRAHIWLGQEVATRVRLAGVDAPELEGACRSERALAMRARAYLAARLATADGGLADVSLSDIRAGKYGGRVLARVRTAGGEDLSQALLAAGLARAYAGKARRPWCTGAG
jgi:endonuclease YncB( thermonuclease family)